jgi:hypothetical protein
MARGAHQLPKVLPGPVMRDPSMHCRWATPETALQAFQGWNVRRVGNLWSSSTLLDTQRNTPMLMYL